MAFRPLRSRRLTRKTCQTFGPHQQGRHPLASLPWSALRADLHPDSVGIDHVKACKVALERLDATLGEIAHGRVLVITRDADRKMVHRGGGLFEIERDQRAGIAEPEDISCRFPAHLLEAEHLLIEFA